MSLAAEQGPTFELWGVGLGPTPIDDTSAAPAAANRLAALRARTELRASWPNHLIVGITTAVVAAMIVHFASSGPGAATGPTLASTQALAAAVNLRLADVPGFRVGSGSAGVTATADPAAAFTQCFGTIYGTAGIDSPTVNSPAFVVGDGLQSAAVGSSVSIASDTQLANDGSLAGDPAFPQCFAAALASVTWSAPGVSVTGSNPSTTTLPQGVAATGTVEPILSMRATSGVNAGSRSIPVTVDVYVVTVGHDELTFYAFAAGKPFQASRERQLVSLLVHRALARR